MTENHVKILAKDKRLGVDEIGHRGLEEETAVKRKR
jgi:hypothetical protein